jgi:Protein of unknown function DUF262
MNYNSSEQMINWFKDEYAKGTLTIKPPFQRKPVWASRQKCYLIESILLGLPVPEIYIQRIVSPEGLARYALVDGQQRIRTVLQFIGSETDPKEEEFNKFALDKLKDQSPWKNKTFADLPDEEKVKFYNYVFAVRFLNTNSDPEVRDMFRRLNEFQTQLKPQELRNAIFAGPFITLSEKLADNQYWAENRIISPALIRRMNDIEFVSELLIGVIHGPQGGSAKDIDEYYEQYEDFEDEFPEQRKATKLFDETLETVHKILPDIKETRWSNKTDFYTLFVALSSQLRTHKLVIRSITKVRRALESFAEEVDRRLADERARVSKNAINYVRAVEKGANDKKRRADRQAALLQVIGPSFQPKRSTP